jgi:tetratricopeptide (TPR) repeat protein
MGSPQRESGAGAAKAGGGAGKGKGKSQGPVKRCPYCGAKNKANFEYCIRCSEPLDESAPEGLVAQDRATLGRLFVLGVVAVVALAAVALIVRAVGNEPAASAEGTGGGPTASANLAPSDVAAPAIESKEVLASFNAGLAAFNARDYRAAADLFAEVVRELPENPSAHQYLGLSYYHLGEYPNALSALAAARALRPDSFELLDHYVTTAKKAGDLDAAAVALREYIDRHPDATAARLELSRVARTQGNADEALQQAEAIAQAQGDTPEAKFELGVSLKEAGRLDEAIAALKSSIEMNPESAVAHHALGVTELLSGKTKEAVGSLEAAVARAPENGDFRFSLAQAYEKLDRVPESLAAYEAYLKYANASDPRAKVVRDRLEVAKKALAERERSERGRS